MREDLLTFAAHASHPDLGDEVPEGRLTINRWQLRFESERVTLEFPINRVEIEIADAETGEIGLSRSNPAGLSAPSTKKSSPIPRCSSKRTRATKSARSNTRAN